MVNRAFAQRFFPEGALGKRVRPPGMDIHGERWLEVVGVVGDVRYRSLAREPMPQIFVGLKQRPSAAYWAYLIARTEVEPDSVRDALGAALRQSHPRLPVALRSMDEVLAGSLERTRFLLRVLAAFALLATLLVITGIAGLVSSAVSERGRELSVRRALGAPRLNVLLLVIQRSLGLLALGSPSVGVGCSVFAFRLVANQLYGVTPTDGATIFWNSGSAAGVRRSRRALSGTRRRLDLRASYVRLSR